MKFLFRSRKLLEYNFYIRHDDSVIFFFARSLRFLCFSSLHKETVLSSLTTPEITSSSGFLWRSARCSADWLEHSLEKSRRNRNPSAIVACACTPISRTPLYRHIYHQNSYLSICHVINHNFLFFSVKNNF